MLENEGNLEEALKIYTESLLYYPIHYELRIAIGRTQRLLENYDQSIKIFGNFLKMYPTDPNINFELAKSYYADGSIKKALGHLEIVLEVWENADANYKQAIEAREKWAQWNQVN